MLPEKPQEGSQGIVSLALGDASTPKNGLVITFFCRGWPKTRKGQVRRQTAKK
jgi:hypothetical protein